MKDEENKGEEGLLPEEEAAMIDEIEKEEA